MKDERDGELDWVRAHWHSLGAPAGMDSKVVEAWRRQAGDSGGRRRWWFPVAAAALAAAALILSSVSPVGRAYRLAGRAYQPAGRAYRPVAQPRILDVSQGDRP